MSNKNQGIFGILARKPLYILFISGIALLLSVSVILVGIGLQTPDDNDGDSIFQSDINLGGSSMASTENSETASGTVSGPAGSNNGGGDSGIQESASGSTAGGSGAGSGNSGSASGETPDASIKATIRTTTIPGYQKVVSECSVMDFGAAADGKTDDTAKFQNALNYVAELGGGVVWVPKGQYYFSYSLNIPKSCYLVGEWYNPDSEPLKIKSGTIFLVHANKGSDDVSKPFISLGTGAGVVGLTIFYPEQSYTGKVKYPPTFLARDGYQGRSGYPTIKYTTIVNPYNAINFGPQGNELAYVDHVYMSPLNRGVFINLSTDVSRIQNLHISARYYALYDKSINQTSLADEMKKSVIGMRIQRSDWQSLNYSSIRDVYIAIKLEKQDPVTHPPVNSGNLESFELTISNCRIGFYFEFNETIHQLTNIDISTDEECFLFTSGFSGSVGLTGSTLKSQSSDCVVMRTGAIGSFAMTDSSFAGWGSGKYPVAADGGGILVDNCTAAVSGDILIDSDARGATVSNVRNLEVVNRIGTRASVSTGSYVEKNYTAFPEIPAFPKTSGPALISVVSKGAKADGSQDCTAAFQNTIDEVKSKGGGIAYIPAGTYRIGGTLSVPEGVELRGVSQGPHHSSAMGSVLFTTQGAGNENGTPFITLGKGAGLRGFLVWYPDQIYNNPKTYPWTVLVEKSNAWMIDVTIAGAWHGVKLGNGSGAHYLSGVTGFSFKTDILIDGSDSRSYIINSHFNPHFYGRALVSELPGTGCMFETAKFIEFLSLLDGMKDSFILGKSKSEVLFGSFNYRARVGVTLNEGFDGILKGCGYDACNIGIKSNGGAATLINFLSDAVPSNSQYVSMSAGSLKMINSGFSAFNWSPGDTASPYGEGLNISGGVLQIRLMVINASTASGAFKVSGGTVNVAGAVFRHYGASKGSGQNTIFGNQTANVKDLIRTGGTFNVSSALGRLFINTASLTSGTQTCKIY
ncbi:MAG: glycosyl hydrolase family 28-related protein [Saccharofermentanales bacterium]